MIILALDTTAKTASAALVSAEGDTLTLLGQYFLRTAAHSATLLPMVESLTKNAGIPLTDVGLMAVAGGPGSFTGVRIGVSAVKGLAFPNQTPAVCVSSLEALAMNLSFLPGLILPAIDARRSTVYGAAFRSDGKGHLTRLSEDEQLEWDDFIAPAERERRADPALPVYGCGDAWELSAERAALVSPVPAELRYPTGFGVAAAAYRLYREAPDPSVFTEASLAPIYLKKSQAERDREAALMQSPINE